MNRIYAVVAFDFRDRGPSEEIAAYLSDAAIFCESRMDTSSTTGQRSDVNPEARTYLARKELLEDGNDDAHAMMLIRKFNVGINRAVGHNFVYIVAEPHDFCVTFSQDNLNRAIEECVAKMQAAA